MANIWSRSSARPVCHAALLTPPFKSRQLDCLVTPARNSFVTHFRHSLQYNSSRKMPSTSSLCLLLAASWFGGSVAQDPEATGYFGYQLHERGDEESATFQTLDTPANVSVFIPEPDVYLHAQAHVGEIDILYVDESTIGRVVTKTSDTASRT